jgi:CheY-like chemotaxis protein
MRVLIVDDNEMTLGIVKLVLAKMPGIRSAWPAGTPRRRSNQALTGTFDIILPDYIMPDMDGLTFARIVRSTAASSPCSDHHDDRLQIGRLVRAPGRRQHFQSFARSRSTFSNRQTLRDTFNHSKFSGETETQDRPVRLRRVPKLVAMGGQGG